jgi:hypothetical protein
MRIHWFLAVCSLTAFAQLQDSVSTSTVTARGAIQGSMGFGGRGFMGTPVTGAPYSAQRVSEHVQVGADGTRFTQNNRQETIYRDSQGRTRTERAMAGPNGPPDAPTVIEIQDPVGKFSYTLDTQNKVAHRVALQTPEMRMEARAGSGAGVGTGVGGSMGAVTATTTVRTGVMQSGIMSASIPPPPPGAAAVAARPRPEVKQDDLGTQVIEGVVAQGHRTTQTWAAGSQGNDRPFQVVNETWFSSDIKEMVLSINTDPRSGENTTKLINISRNEPSADLFMPPADYQVVDETGPFQIHWTAQRQ